MKNKLFIIGLFVFAGFMTSCDHNNPNHDKFDNDPESGYVNFNSTTSSEGNDVEFAKVPVTLTAPVNSSGLELTASAVISAGSAEGTNIGPVHGSVGKDSLQGYLNVPIQKNLGEYAVALELTGTSRDNVNVGLDTLKITKDTLYVGKGGTIGTFNGAADISGTPVNTFTTTVTGIGFENGNLVYSIQNAWGDNFVQEATGDPDAGVTVYDATFVFNDDNTFTINSETQPGGTGTFDPSTDTYELELQQTVFSQSFTVHVVLEKQ